MVSSDSRDSEPKNTERIWRFSDCVFDELRLALLVKGQSVDLEWKPMEVLLQLLRRSGEVVSKEALLEGAWPGLMVVDGSLATAVSKLRKALGDLDGSIVVTVPRVGYRIGVPVHSELAAALPPPLSLPLKPGEPVPHRPQWRLLRALDAPERAEVWLAEQPKTHERRVFKFAVSTSRLKSLKREVTVARFLRESLGDSPDFVRILEWNFELQPAFIESVYGGDNLAEWAEKNGGLSHIPLSARLQIFARVVQSVAVAHNAGVLHQDLKPANILIGGGSGSEKIVSVADFGAASLLDPSRLHALGITNLGLTQTNVRATALAGTLMYLAPELISGHPPTARSDIFALGVMLYQLVVGDFRKPLSPGWEAEVKDDLLREDIALAASGDPALRLSSAADLADRVSRLDQRKLDRRNLETQREKARLALRKAEEARVRRPWILLAAAAIVAAGIAGFVLFKKTRPGLPLNTVAILPFQNPSADSGLDFLRAALPDEIATTLSHMQPLAIRPLASSAKYSTADVNFQQAGRDLGVSSLITGRFLRVGNQLQITMEAIDVEKDRILWNDTFNIPVGNLLALQAQVAASARGKLAPILGASVSPQTQLPPPKNEQAYDLYLRSVPLDNNPEPNKKALDMLERSVALDSGFAPAWFALSGRAYANSRLYGGGAAMIELSDQAAERALSLDPDFVDAAAELTLHRAERGELVRAYQQAQDLVQRRPDNAQAHHLLSYVLRYAGLLEESAHQCDMAILLDQQTLWTPCSSTFLDLGNYRRALDLLRKDLGSEFTKSQAIQIFIRQGDPQKALQVRPPRLPGWDSYVMLQACAQGRPQSEISALASAVQPSDDPEMNYFFSSHLAYCGQTKPALGMLKRAIAGGYCSYPVLDTDPFFAPLRPTPEFAELRSSAIACQNKFLAEKDKRTN